MYRRITIWAISALIALSVATTALSDEQPSELIQIISDEGIELCQYTDTEGHPTIGYGHLITASDDFPRCITRATARTLLHSDYLRAERSVARYYPWAEQQTRLVLINMTYQLGTEGLASFRRFLRAVEERDRNLAAVEMLNSLWAKQTPERAGRLAIRILTNRRVCYK